MKFKFQPDLDYQLEAIRAVVDLFEGQPHGQEHNFLVSERDGLKLQTRRFGNSLLLDNEQLLTNTHKIQQRNSINKVTALQGERDFSIEMETGTGKTYVYLRTIFELNKCYGFKKFIIVVPSIAVREGVIKSIEVMREHFQTNYNNIPFEYYLYDSKRLNKIRSFSDSSNIQIMVINIQAFQKDASDDGNGSGESDKTNVIYRDSDRMGGRPIDFIGSVNPIVIVDEPQSVDNTPKSRSALEKLNPMVRLRYSATHRDRYNLLYKLGPIEAYEQRLVKRIEVASIHRAEDYSSGYVKYLEGKAGKTDRAIRAKLEIYKETAAGPKLAQIWVKLGDDLYQRSNKNIAYQHGFSITGIMTSHPAVVYFSSGKCLPLNKEIGGGKDEVIKAMLRETIAQHLQKETDFRGHGIKVLSLFFIDRVANYRIYNKDGSTGLGKIGRWFEEIYRELAETNAIDTPAVGQLHGGYFSQDRRGQDKDTKGNTKVDEGTYAKIMRHKERLLDPDEPLRFIFSHTALREGWDNPNVFQICTLREVGSEIERRQQIGRGLRLPVNKNGERIHDYASNKLTVIAAEGYEEYAAALQKEYEQELGIVFDRITEHQFASIIYRSESGQDVELGQEKSSNIWEFLQRNGYIDADGKVLDCFSPDTINFDLTTLPELAQSSVRDSVIDEIRKTLFKDRVANAHKKKKQSFNKSVYLSDDFKELWQNISQRTRCRINFETGKLIGDAIKRVSELPEVKPLRLASKVADIELKHSGIGAVSTGSKQHQEVKPSKFPNIVDQLQKETELTRHTLVKILISSNRGGDFYKNPHLFTTLAGREISQSMQKMLADGIQYQKIDGSYWEMQRIEEDARQDIAIYLNKLYEVKNRNKSLYDSIVCDSEVEKRFATDLDNNKLVKVFAKLPSWFKIDTPFGSYNPDWAFVTEGREKLYFVRETKGTTNPQELRQKENDKIRCGRLHFKETGTDFDVVTNLGEVDIR